MKSIKGLALGAALAGVVFTGAVTADAATIGKDTEGTKYQEATTKLAALNITKGYPDGTVRPDENVTRAQTAAFMIRALNYQLAMDQSTTNFGDVGYDHPLSGAVQLASGRDIVKGYLDGTFRPEESVTVAQASAILVRMLGYSPAINEADFPNSHLSKAAELGILKNVNADVNAPAKRGDIMLMIANALTVDLMKQTEWGNDHKWEERKDENLLTEFFDLTVIETRGDFKDIKSDSYEGDLPLVRDTARTKIGSLKADEIEFAGGIGGTHTLNEMFNATDFLAQEVQVWVDEDDDYVAYIADSKDQRVVVDQADKWDNSAKTKIKLDNGKKYTIKKDARIYYNLEDVVEFDDLDDKDVLVDGTVMLKVVLDSNEDAVAIVATSLDDAEGYGIVDEVNTGREILNFMDGSSSVSQLKLDGKDFFIVRDGDIATLEDIENEDVINYYRDGDDYYILATSDKASGEIENVTSTDLDDVGSYKLVIDGKKYNVAPKATFSENDNEDIDEVDTDDLDELDAVDATLYLNPAGEVQHILTGELDSTVGNVAVVTKNVKWLIQDEKWELTVVNEFGKEVKYRFENDDIDIDGEEFSDQEIYNNLTIQRSEEDLVPKNVETAKDEKANYIFIEYSTNRDGDLKSIDILKEDAYKEKYNTVTSSEIDLDKYDDNIKVDGSTYRVTRNTVFFDVTKAWDGSEYDDVDTVAWDDIKDKDINTATVKVKTNDRDAEYVFVTDAEGNLTSKGDYGFITGFKKVGRDDAFTLTRIDGEKLTIIYNESDLKDLKGDQLDSKYDEDLLAKGAFIRYELDTDDEIDKFQIIATAGTKGGFYINDGSESTYGNLSIDLVKHGVVSKSTTSTVTLLDAEGKNNKGNVVVNSNTVYIDLIDDGEMEITGGVNRGDFVLAIDSDDDGNAADFVIIIDEDRVYDKDADKDDGKEEDGKVTYVNADEGLIEVDGKVLELDNRVRLVDAEGTTLAIGPIEVASELEKGDVLDKVIQKDGVVTEIKLKGDEKDPEEPGGGDEPGDTKKLEEAVNIDDSFIFDPMGLGVANVSIELNDATITDAIVTVNGKEIAYDADRGLYFGNIEAKKDEVLDVVVTIGDVEYTGKIKVL